MSQRHPLPYSLLALSLLFAQPAAAVIPTGFSQVVLFASESIQLKKGVDVTSGSIVANLGGAGIELRLAKDALTPAGYTLMADSIDIDKDSVVGGDVHYNELDNDGTILGSEVTPLSLPVFAFLPPFFTGSSAGPDVDVPNGGALTLAPGDYGAVTLGKGATLTFTGGTYNVAAIAAEKDSRIEFAAATAVRVAGSVDVDKDSYVGASAGGPPASELVLYVAGSGTAVDFDKNAEVAVSIYAPNGTLDIDKDGQLTGAFLAQHIVVDLATRFTLDSFFFNRPPVAVDDGPFVTAEDGHIAVIDVLANDSDPDGDDLTITANPTAPFGTVTVNDSGTPGDPTDDTLSYTPNPNSNDNDGDHSFQYEVCDDGTDPGPLCATATVFISVTPVNDPPVIDDQSLATDEQTGLTIDLTGNDVENDDLIYAIVSVDFGSPPIGSLTAFEQGPPTLPANAARVNFFPAGDGTLGTGSFVYEVCDDGTPPGPECDQATVTIEVVAFNNPPAAENQSVFTGGAASVPITLVATDVEDPVLAFSLLSPPSHGSLSGLPVSGASAPVVYAPNNPTLEEADSFVFRACDAGVPIKCASGAVTINSEEPLNNPPQAQSQSVDTNGDVDLPLVLTASDPDGDTLTFSILAPPSFGVLVGLADVPPTSASVTYDPNTDGDLEDSFVFLACDDGTPMLCASATVSINAEDETENDAPAAQADSIRVAPGGTATTLFPSGTSLLANDSDPNGDSLSVTTTPVSGPSHGTLTLAADGTFSYTNTDTAAASDQFVYEICDDGSPVLCDTATVFVTIVPPSITVTVTRSGSGTGEVTSSPAGIDCGATCSAVFDTATDLPIGLTATPDAGSLFAGWSGAADCADGVLGAAADATCNAVFSLLPPPTGDPVTVTMALAGDGGGRVLSAPEGIDCDGPLGDCSEIFAFGTRVTFAATADEGSTFGGFGGDGDCLDGELSGVVDASCSATFDLEPEVQHTLTILFAGDGAGSVTSDDFSLSCSADCSGLFADGATVVLNARPDPGSAFGGYGAGCGTVSGFRATLVMGDDATCTATFNGPQ